MKKYLLFLLLYSFHSAFGQIDAHAKFSALSYLAQGKVNCYFTPAIPTKMGTCAFDYQCKKGFFAPFSDTVETLFNYWTSIIATYPLKDSLRFYDSLHFRLYSYDDTVISKRHNILYLPNLPKRSTTEVERLGALLHILPFYTQATYSADSVELRLWAIPGYSPQKDMSFYMNILHCVIYDYVYRRRPKHTVIVYIVENKGALRFHMDTESLDIYWNALRSL